MEGLQLLASSAALAVANAFLHAEVAELAVRDPLTGLYNRRHFDEALDRMLAAHRRERLTGWRPMSAIMFDLDRFGLFNKEHGHQVGDDVLSAFADVLTSRFRASDLVARLGGEEFIVVLDGADREEAVAHRRRGARPARRAQRSRGGRDRSCRSPSRPAVPSSIRADADPRVPAAHRGRGPLHGEARRPRPGRRRLGRAESRSASQPIASG